jgi:hypothetical protein
MAADAFTIRDLVTATAMAGIILARIADLATKAAGIATSGPAMVTVATSVDEQLTAVPWAVPMRL